VSHARAAIAGAVVMLLGVWIMTNDQTGWTTQDVVFAVLALLIVVLLLLGIDVRRGRNTDGD
jgi:uncharacterized membrane protein YdfJ with MMPL/SSD domain